MIGVASLISMLAVGNGTRKSIEKEISNFGSNILVVHPGTARKDGISAETGVSVRLSIDDIDDLKVNIVGIQSVCGYTNGRVQIIANGKNYNTRFEGVSSDYVDLKKSYLYKRRFFTETENKEKKKLVLLGKTVIKELYGDKNFNSVGEYLKLANRTFKL
jgi:macrolide transport system ATP-binding/permease protein